MSKETDYMDANSNPKRDAAYWKKNTDNDRDVEYAKANGSFVEEEEVEEEKKPEESTEGSTEEVSNEEAGTEEAGAVTELLDQKNAANGKKKSAVTKKAK